MSGIFGIINTRGAPLERAWLESMRENMAHRGPDGWGIYHNGSVGLGHLLLQVTPESKYEQSPCHVEGLVVAADARLDAREELMDNLRIPTERWLTITDPEMIGLAYRKWGERCVEHFLGDFAFALWDEGEQTLFCARDHNGIKPFLYCFEHDFFLFASELKTLVQHELISTALDTEVIVHNLFGFEISPQKTSWKNINRLMPAKSLLLSNRQLKTQQYWDGLPQRSTRHKKDEAYFEELRHLLGLSIKEKIRTEYPLGMTLSGGLDSSTIATIATQYLNAEGKKLFAASSVNLSAPDEPKNIDAKYLPHLLRRIPTLEVEFVRDTDFEFIPTAIQDFEVGFDLSDGFQYAHQGMHDALSKKFRVRRVLSGYYGDVTVTNNSIKPLIPLLKNGNLSQARQHLVERQAFLKVPLLNLLKNDLLLPLLGYDIRLMYSKIRKRDNPYHLYDAWYSLLNQQRWPKAWYQTRIKKHHYYSIQQGHPHRHLWHPQRDLFGELGDATDAHRQLENAYPLMDKRILEFLINLPPHLFQYLGKSRGLIRATMATELPIEITERYNKGYFSPGYEQVFANSIPAFEALMDQYDKKGKLNPVFDAINIKNRCVDFNQKMQSGFFDGENYMVLERALMVTLFYDWVEK